MTGLSLFAFGKIFRAFRVVLGAIFSVTILTFFLFLISEVKRHFPLEFMEWLLLGFVALLLSGLLFLSLKVIGKPPEGYAEKVRESLLSQFTRSVFLESFNGSWVNVLPALAYLTLSMVCAIALIGGAESDPKGNLILMQIPLMFPLSVLHLVPWAVPIFVDLSWQRFFLVFIPLNSLLISIFASFIKYFSVTLFMVAKWLITILLNRVVTLSFSKRIGS